MDLRVVLLNPQEEGNVGSIARAMRNFGFSELYLVNPCKLGGVARAFASHGMTVLEKAKTVGTFEQAVKGCDHIVGTTGKKGGHNTPKRKAPLTPEQLAETLPPGKVALVFGNEAYGLLNEVLEQTDFAVRIPANPEYPILNLAQSVCVILYELAKKRFGKTVREKPLTRKMRAQLDQYTREIVKEVYEQPHQQRAIGTTLLRIYGKSMLTEQEGRRIISFYRKIMRKL